MKRRRSKVPFFTEVLEPRQLLSAGLSVTYSSSTNDPSGLATLSYNGVKLVDDSIAHEQFQVNRFYILNGDGSYTQGDGGSGYTTHWNAQTDVLTYTYNWGTITCQYVLVNANRFNMVFTVQNAATSGVTLGGVDIYPCYIHFPFTITPGDEQQIAGNPTPPPAQWNPEVAYGSDGPAVLPADYSDAPTNDGAVMDLVNDGPATRQMYTSLWTTNYTGSIPGKDYFLMAATAPDGNMLYDNAVSTSNGVDTYTAPLFYTNIAPGQSDSFQISLRFGSAGTNPQSLATDIETNYAKAYPSVVNWPDRRPIASLHLASYGSNVGGNYNNSIGNPNSWALTGNQGPSQINITTTAGLNNFSSGLLSYAATAIQQMSVDNSQGMIVWDVEGEEYAQPNPSYIGDPRYAIAPPNGAAPTAPELNYNYNGNGPIINQFFKTFTNAGFRVGVTLRPTQIVYTSGSNPPYAQTPNGGVGAVPIALEVSQLEAKIAYAYSTWGCTLFYVDSTTGFDSAALRTVQAAYPNVLLIPEHNTISTFGTGAAYGELTNDYVGTPASVYATYPSAFSVIYIADGNMSNYASQLVNSLRNGDIMLFRAWFADPNNAVMVSDYQSTTAAPTAPGLWVGAGDGVVNLSWTSTAGRGAYTISRSNSANGTFSPIAFGVQATSFADTTVTNYQTYYYQVTAENGAGTSAASATAEATPAGPSVANNASATSASVTGNTTALSVLGTDSGGESTLTYTWSSVSAPSNAPPPTFSVNGSNLAKNTTARFYQAGTYTFTVTIADPVGYSITSTVVVPVSQIPKLMYVQPGRAGVAAGGTLQYGVQATDQFSNRILSPAVAWSVSGGGSINASGLFTAGSAAGVYTVTASSGTLSASTTVNVQSVVTPAAIVIDPRIDIGNGDLVVQAGGGAGLAEVFAKVQAGSDLAGNAWNGPGGIISSAAASDPTHRTAIGVLLNDNGSGGPIYQTHDGLSVGFGDVLVMDTWYGDANLDGKVDSSDYTRIDNGFLIHATGWSNGDLSYNRKSWMTGN